MALVTCGFRSEVLGIDTSMTAVLPLGADRAAPPALLYLLHGAGGDHTSWLQGAPIARLAEEAGLAVVMPSGGHGYWTDQVRGPRWWTFVADELPTIVRDLFALDPPRERTFAAGLSRGGYGALKLGLRRPERFAAVAGLSAKVDIANEDWSEPWRQDVFGSAERARQEGDDLLTLLAAVDPGACPRLLLSCGTADRLYGENLRFRDAALERDLPVDWTEGPGGHDWEVWDRDIRPVVTRFAELARET
ncbi:alpha/beta hydrolase [Amnibacterium kyonggiense]|uniref:S-formylglutathione hydrolase FrmB n=1 Tax=Amnibacterium kyonggiense TaxID=595671 RepID=A0A4R7FLI7_9MICO|nr:alpha/beta hydrolase family protein [Amnibacterium kyonggiense]TDS77238.1 S-formylglutathione hydrolase FrmB [Amnibacterium kyonggiense]